MSGLRQREARTETHQGKMAWLPYRGGHMFSAERAEILPVYQSRNHSPTLHSSIHIPLLWQQRTDWSDRDTARCVSVHFNTVISENSLMFLLLSEHSLVEKYKKKKKRKEKKRKEKRKKKIKKEKLGWDDKKI